MDDIMVRSRYPRHSVPARRRSRYGRTKSSSNLPKLIVRQVAVCLLIYLVILLVKSIDTPFTNYITGKVQFVLEQNIELNDIFQTVDDALAKLRNGNTTDNLAKDQGTKSNETDTTGKGILAEDDIKPETSVLSLSTENGGNAEISMMVPVNGVLSSSFGERKDPITSVQKMHEGIDVEAAKGEDIIAALAGIVTEAGASPSYGKYLKIKHENGFETVYAHCSSLNAVEGQRVSQGEVIANVGNTGTSVGTHLHFEVWKNGTAVNPLEYITVPLP